LNDDIRRIGPLSQGLKDDAQGLRAHGFDRAAPHIEMRAAEARALEARLWSAEQKIAALEQAIRDAIIEIDEARDYVEGTDLARETLVRALADKGE